MYLCQVEFQTASGQMLDLITTHEGEKDLSKYTVAVYVIIMQDLGSNYIYLSTHILHFTLKQN